ncbi:MAG: hypothetical protein HOE76_06955 [Euryarchaeota archaeon]|jgi:hypothetical protein|nr:hypothetical protein [Euryarchaeota archaeon]MBT4982002.1 hypothetical protein [Euryarchaeota archaeon]MBT5184978.1 hypothetical protein [Euryarchaeota archaeon]
MGEEIEEEPSVNSEDDSVPEMTIEERKDALKKSRWNVFMYLGLAALFFSFALYPFMGISMSADEGFGDSSQPITVWGLPIPGEDFTDIPVEINVVIQALPTDVNSIEIFMIENAEGCDATDGSIESTRNDLRIGKSEHPNSYHIIENPVESQSYEIEFDIDPGIYCVQLVINTQSQNFAGINVEVDIDLYPTQFPLAIFGTVCLLLSVFAFIGAQKHGKLVKSLIEPKEEPTIEETVLAQTSSARITAGPSGPPAPGPSGPPTPGPTGPPAGPPAESPESVDSTEEPVESESEVQSEEGGDVYEDQGDGWFFRKFPDGTYDQAPYMIHEGEYIPYVDPEA